MRPCLIRTLSLSAPLLTALSMHLMHSMHSSLSALTLTEPLHCMRCRYAIFLMLKRYMLEVGKRVAIEAARAERAAGGAPSPSLGELSEPSNSREKTRSKASVGRRSLLRTGTLDAPGMLQAMASSCSSCSSSSIDVAAAESEATPESTVPEVAAPEVAAPEVAAEAAKVVGAAAEVVAEARGTTTTRAPISQRLPSDEQQQQQQQQQQLELQQLGLQQPPASSRSAPALESSYGSSNGCVAGGGITRQGSFQLAVGAPTAGPSSGQGSSAVRSPPLGEWELGVEQRQVDIAKELDALRNDVRELLVNSRSSRALFG